MSAPVAHAQRWWLRPTIALPAVTLVIAVVTLFTPQPQEARGGDSRLSTYSASAQGARLLHDLAGRLGWTPRRHLRPEIPADSNAVIALLAPTVPMSGAEAHAILEHVRGGGALLYVHAGRSPLTDSLALRIGGGYRAEVRPEIAGPIDEECADEDNGALPMWLDGDMFLWSIGSRDADRELVTFVETFPESPGAIFGTQSRGRSRPAADSARVPRPAAIGFQFGAGRVVAIADPDLLRNDVVRVCRWAADVAFVRMLEYLTPEGRRPIVFDEFRQGHGHHPGTFTAIARFFSRTAPGQALGQLLLAGIVLLLAAAPRLVPPRDAGRIARRDPGEHVQALARAYEKVGATRTAVLRLLHGLRRRVARQGPPAIAAEGSPDALLDWIVRRAPSAADDVSTVRHGLAQPVASRDLVRIAEAIRRIEDALTQSPLARAGTTPRRPTATTTPS